MTIMEAIGKVDALKANAYSQAEKVGWLNELDKRIKTLVIDTHEGGGDVTFTGYDARLDIGRQLLAPDSFADLYIWWLCAQIDFHNEEIQRYNESISLFNGVWDGYVNWYNRNHMPIGRRFRYF